jgi:hypothetical protein
MKKNIFIFSLFSLLAFSYGCESYHRDETSGIEKQEEQKEEEFQGPLHSPIREGGAGSR